MSGKRKRKRSRRFPHCSQQLQSVSCERPLAARAEAIDLTNDEDGHEARASAATSTQISNENEVEFILKPKVVPMIDLLDESDPKFSVRLIYK